MKKVYILVITAITLATLFSAGKLSAQDNEADESVSEKIEEKLTEEVQPRAYLGTITDKTESGLQIKNDEGDIEQISVIEDATYAKQTDKTTTITFDDIAIGDYIMAMGFISSGKLLEAQRVIVTDPPERANRVILKGSVMEIDNTELTVSAESEQESTFAFPRRWVGPDKDEIAEGDEVAVVGVQTEDDLELRTIELLSSPTPSPDAVE